MNREFDVISYINDSLGSVFDDKAKAGFIQLINDVSLVDDATAA